VKLDLVFANRAPLVDTITAVRTLALLKIELENWGRSETNAAWLVNLLHFWIVLNMSSHVFEYHFSLGRIECDQRVAVLALDHVCKPKVAYLTLVFTNKASLS
jgi:hypothetical protein